MKNTILSWAKRQRPISWLSLFVSIIALLATMR